MNCMWLARGETSSRGSSKSRQTLSMRKYRGKKKPGLEYLAKEPKAPRTQNSYLGQDCQGNLLMILEVKGRCEIEKLFHSKSESRPIPGGSERERGCANVR